MNTYPGLLGLLSAAGLAAGLRGAGVSGRTGADSVEAHVAAARAAAGKEHAALLNLCNAPAPAPPAAQRAPERSQWHAEPVKVFDNLYFVGQTEYSAWAVTTSAGIILIDTIFDYSVEDEVVGGLKKLGLDPATIKYAIVSHGHADHSGGAKYLQDRFGARVILSAADWDLLDREHADRAEARHGGHRRPEAHARRHDADDVHHAGPHARHDLDADPGEGPRHAAPGRRVGRHRVQLGREPRRLHHARAARSLLVRDLQRLRASGSATSPRRPAPT